MDVRDLGVTGDARETPECDETSRGSVRPNELDTDMALALKTQTGY